MPIGYRSVEYNCLICILSEPDSIIRELDRDEEQFLGKWIETAMQAGVSQILAQRRAERSADELERQDG